MTRLVGSGRWYPEDSRYYPERWDPDYSDSESSEEEEDDFAYLQIEQELLQWNEEDLYKERSLEGLSIEFLPQNSTQVRAFRRMLLGQLASIDRSGKSLLVNYYKRPFAAVGSLESIVRRFTESSAVPRLDGFIGQLIAKHKDFA